MAYDEKTITEILEKIVDVPDEEPPVVPRKWEPATPAFRAILLEEWLSTSPGLLGTAELFSQHGHRSLTEISQLASFDHIEGLSEKQKALLHTKVADTVKFHRFLFKYSQEDKYGLVMFDQDNTAVAMHSGGVLRRSMLETYCKKTCEEFVTIVLLLLDRDERIAVGSFTDRLYYTMDYSINEYIAGVDLTSAFLAWCFSQRLDPEVAIVSSERGTAAQAITDKIYICGLYPALWANQRPDTWKARLPNNKTTHMRRALADAGILGKKKGLLFDDSKGNMKTDENFYAFRTDGNVGFRLSDFTDEQRGFKFAG